MFQLSQSLLPGEREPIEVKYPFPLPELSTYICERSPLTDLAIPRRVLLEKALQLPDHIACRLTELSLFYPIDETSEGAFGLLCNRLPSLVHLSIVTILPPARFLVHLVGLPKLTSLSYNYRASERDTIAAIVNCSA